MQFLAIIFCVLFSIYSEAGRIRLRKVKDAPKTCTIMKEDSTLSRTNKKILGTEKNSIIIDDQITLVGDLGQKQCVWPGEKFLPLGELKKINFYIDEYKNLMVAYHKNESSTQQVQIHIDGCQIDEFKTLSQVSLPKCDPPKKIRKSKRKKVAKR